MALYAVIFDIDGTLVNSVDAHARAWQEAFAKFGKEISFERIRHQIGKGGDQLLPVFLSEDELADFGEELDHFRCDLFKRQYLPELSGFPKVRKLFEALRGAGSRIALASSAKGDELAHYQRLTHIEDLVDAETSADDLEQSKSRPDIFQAALRKLGSPPLDAVVVVGDTPYDAIAARRAGLHTIGVLCGGFPERELREAGCVEIYRDPADLLARSRHTLLARDRVGALDASVLF